LVYIESLLVTMFRLGVTQAARANGARYVWTTAFFAYFFAWL